MNLYKRLSKNLIECQNLIGDSPDFTKREFKVKGKKYACLFYESLSSDDKVSDLLLRNLFPILEDLSFLDNIITVLQNKLTNSKICIVKDFNNLNYYIASGFTILLVDGYNNALAIETREALDRGIGEAKMEVNIKGPRDAFLENYNKNIGLIRKRIKDENLRFKEYIIGRRTKTKIAVTYINDIAEHERVKHIIDKISDIDTDAILDASYLKDFFRRDSRTGFPTIITTERPDIVCSSILDGKIAIVVENSPAVLVFPAVLTDFIHAADDNYQKAINVSLTRILRMIALFITLYAPALYVAATTFNQEIIPSTLLLSIAKQRSGVPFPTTFSVLLLMITFEILRESDMRMPESMGTSISIVGALVLGEAAVSAGIVSPIVIIVIAITSITGLLFSDLDIINAFRWWRLIFLLFASTLGLVGIIGASLIFVVKLCRIESMGVPYLTPFSPLYIKSLKNSTISLPNNESKERPQYYTENIRRMK